MYIKLKRPWNIITIPGYLTNEEKQTRPPQNNHFKMYMRLPYVTHL